MYRIIVVALGIVALAACASGNGSSATDNAANAISTGAKRAARDADRLAADPRVRNAGREVSDAALSARVTAAVAGQAGINAFKISASARRGVVTLAGAVPSAAVAHTIVETTRSVSGVRGVVDRIVVKR